MPMQTNQQWCYLAPEIEVNETCVEQGFIGSNMEQIGEEKPEQVW